jgi:hypothetical protein
MSSATETSLESYRGRPLGRPSLQKYYFNRTRERRDAPDGIRIRAVRRTTPLRAEYGIPGGSISMPPRSLTLPFSYAALDPCRPVRTPGGSPRCAARPRRFPGAGLRRCPRPMVPLLVGADQRRPPAAERKAASANRDGAEAPSGTWSGSSRTSPVGHRRLRGTGPRCLGDDRQRAYVSAPGRRPRMPRAPGRRPKSHPPRRGRQPSSVLSPKFAE